MRIDSSPETLLILSDTNVSIKIHWWTSPVVGTNDILPERNPVIGYRSNLAIRIHVY